MKLSTHILAFMAMALLSGALALGAVACGDDDDGDDGDPTATSGAEPTDGETPAVEGEAGQLDITAVEYSFENVPASIPGGLTTITLDNIGGDMHQVQFTRLNDGVTVDQFTQSFEDDPTGVQALAQIGLRGGVNAIPAGTKGQVVNELDAGQYVLLCFISGDDDIPHFTKGMIAELEVTEPAAEQPEPPDTDGSVLLQDFEFRPPVTLPPGEVTLQVANNGPQPHEMSVLRLAEGVTVDDI
ncbi:MAG: hypothetical protein WD939_08285, partial [Dehalococcoidia bacterium]